MKRAMILILVLALTLVGSTALAMPIRSNGGTMTLPVTGLDDAVETELELGEFQLVAANEDGSYLIYADHRFYNVDAAALQSLLAADLPEVEPLGGLETLNRGRITEGVARLQEALVALGYLEGVADGDFGGGTERAVKAFQAAEGMEETGVADERLQRLVQSMVAEAIEIEPVVEPEVMYAVIAGRTSVDLQPIMDSGLILDYDDMVGEGFISDSTGISFDGSGDSDIEKYRLNVRFGLLARENELGNVDLLPAAKVSCLCVRRPVLNGLMVKAGAFRGAADIESLEATLSGVDSLETGMVLLDENMVNALAAAEEAGELKLRLTGQYNTFDFVADDAQLATLSNIGRLAQQILG